MQEVVYSKILSQRCWFPKQQLAQKPLNYKTHLLPPQRKQHFRTPGFITAFLNGIRAEIKETSSLAFPQHQNINNIFLQHTNPVLAD